MSSELHCRNKNTTIIIKEAFEEDIKIGDAVIMHPMDRNFLSSCSEAYKKAPICIIQETGLCWYDKDTNTYENVYEGLHKITVYVYKINTGAEEKKLLSLSSDLCRYFNNDLLEIIYRGPYIDILSRRPEPGDLILGFGDYDLKDSFYMLYINDFLLYGGYFIIDGVNPYFYIIKNPNERELEIKRHLTRKYNKIMQLGANVRRNGLSRGDYFFGNSRYYIYLGDTDEIKGISLYLKIIYCSAIQMDKLIDDIEKNGVNYDNLLNYVSSNEIYYSIELEKKCNVTLKYGGHIDINISNKEIFNIFNRVYDDILDKNKCNTNKHYNSLEELKIDYDKLLMQLSADINKKKLKFTEEFNGDYECYKKQINSCIKCDTLNRWYNKNERLLSSM